MKSYNKSYLHTAKKNLAHCFDYAINDQKIDGEYFYSMFANSKYTVFFEEGNPSVLVGISGTELAMKILNEKMQIEDFNKQVYKSGRTKEYWIGYSLCEYQWRSSRSFKKIKERVSYKDLVSMYKTYHEMDIERFVEALDEMTREEAESSGKLKKVRNAALMSQSDLAVASGVNIRSIRAYEQNTNNIERAEYHTLKMISSALRCDISDIV